MADTWSPSTYLRFKDERTRAASDLLAQVPLASARKVVDVGCGPGNSTALLVARFPEADVVGVDSSPAMIEEARKVVPSARFMEADATTWRPSATTDLAIANAIYQGTGLRPFVDPLLPDERQEFLRRYRDRIAEAYAPAADGKVLMRFPRLFIVAVR